jgi:hypothetical protein
LFLMMTKIFLKDKSKSVQSNIDLKIKVIYEN